MNLVCSDLSLNLEKDVLFFLGTRVFCLLLNTFATGSFFIHKNEDGLLMSILDDFPKEGPVRDSN